MLVFNDYVAAAARRWWIHMLRGVLSILFALAAITWPNITLAVLVALVAAWALIVGVVEISVGLHLRSLLRSLK